MPSKEAAPRLSLFIRHGSRHARHVRGILPHCDERPARGGPERRLRRRDAGFPVGSERPTPANIVTAVCGDSNPDTYLIFAKGEDGVPYARVLLQVTMCPHS